MFEKFLGAQATGGLEIQGRRDTVPMQFWDGEKITVEEVTQDQIGGYAELGLIKQINDNSNLACLEFFDTQKFNCDICLFVKGTTETMPGR